MNKETYVSIVTSLTTMVDNSDIIELFGYRKAEGDYYNDAGWARALKEGWSWDQVNNTHWSRILQERLDELNVKVRVVSVVVGNAYGQGEWSSWFPEAIMVFEENGKTLKFTKQGDRSILYWANDDTFDYKIEEVINENSCN